MDNTQEISFKKLSGKWKWALIGVVGLVVSPIIFAIVKGLLGLIVAGAVGLTALNLAPWFGMKMANMKMKLIVGEAKANPIETMKNVFIEKSKEIQEADHRIVAFDTSIADYHDKMVNFKRKYPDEAPRYEEIENKMRRGLQNMQRKQASAKSALKELGDEITKAEAIYGMALAVANVTELSQDAEAKVYQDIKQQVSFDSVNSKLNSAVAQLNLEVNQQDELKSLPLLDSTSVSATVDGKVSSAQPVYRN